VSRAAWRRPARAVLVVVVLWIAGACSSESPAGSGRSAAALRRVELRPSEEVLLAASDRAIPLDAITVHAERDGGRVAGARRFVGGDTLRLAIEGPFDLRSFGHLWVRASSSERGSDVPVTLRVQVFRPSGRILGAPVEVPLDAAPRSVALELPPAARDLEPAERIRLVVQPGEREHVDVHGLRFGHAFASTLVRPGLVGGGVGLVDLGSDARRVQPLVGAATASADVEPGGAESLELDVAFPPPLTPAEDARLVVSWDGEPLASVKPRSRQLWRTVRVPLDGHDSGRLTVAFEDAPDGFALIGEPRLVRPVAEPATVLLITSDTHRADHLAIAPGATDVRTPGLDALARRGLLFSNAQSSTNVTVPSHAALLSGVHPKDTGVRDNRSAIADEAPLLAEAFRDAGWMTLGAVGVDILSDAHSQLGQGFDRLSAPVGTREASVAVQSLLDWLPDAEGLPLFCWLHVYDAHRPYEPPRAFVETYWDATRDPRDPALPDPGERGYRMPKAHADIRDPEFLNALYRAEVSSLDAELERLLAEPRFARAVIGFTADHGECLGEHGSWTHRELTPHTLRVPLVVAWPGGPEGEVDERPVGHLGLGRTLLDLAGLQDAPFAGRNLLEDADRAPRFALGGDARSASVTWRGHYLVLHLEDHRVVDGVPLYRRHAVELYDLDADPDCQHDVQRERESVARELRALLVGWLASGGARGWLASRTDDEAVLEELAQLGYLYGEDAAEADGELLDPDCACERCARWR